MSTDPRVDEYIAKKPEFARPILERIRACFHAANPEIAETIKWSHPFFTYKGELLANMAAFTAHASFGFWNRSEVRTGQEGEAMGQFGRLKTLDDMPDDVTLNALMREQIAAIDAGAKPKRALKAPKPELEVPPALVAALAKDMAAKATFDAFPPGARREYSEWIADAKRDETRDKRIADAIEWLREGKRRNWKYENC